MKTCRTQLFAVLTTLALGLGLTAATAAPAQAAGMDSRFAREVVRPGDVDRDQYHIEHVYELQYRLRWAGLLSATPNGQFGPQTTQASRRFHMRHDLPATAVMGREAWRLLIRETIRAPRRDPKVCRSRGWHACYNRARHQVNLYHNGTLHNSWLVRGGSSSTRTRTGDFVVFRRDKDHYSNLFANAPMPYSQFFSGGQALHGSRNMMDPFVGHSHGCVNMYVEDARQLWNLTHDKRLHVHVRGRWS